MVSVDVIVPLVLAYLIRTQRTVIFGYIIMVGSVVEMETEALPDASVSVIQFNRFASETPYS